MKSENLISPAYLTQLSQKHELDASWGNTGHVYSDHVHGLIAGLGLTTTSVLDYGCGKSSLAAALKDVPGICPIIGYDPAVRGAEQLPEPADLVVCTDVMEHVEEDKVRAVLEHIASLTKKVVFFAIATGPAHHKLPDGRNAHITQKPMSWWLEAMSEFFSIDTADTHRETFIAVCQPWTPELIAANAKTPDISTPAKAPKLGSLAAGLGRIGR